MHGHNNIISTAAGQQPVILCQATCGTQARDARYYDYPSTQQSTDSEVKIIV